MAESAGQITKAIRYPGFFTLLVGWSLLGSLACVRHILLDHVPHTHIARELAGWLTCYLPWVLLTPLVFWMERKLPLNRARWRAHALLLVAAGLPLCYLSAAMTVAVYAAEQLAIEGMSPNTTQWWRMPNGEYAFQIALYFVAVLAAWMIRTVMESHESERRAARLALEKAEVESCLRKSELEMLRMRLNPHFLFNSLQNISTLARQDPPAASQMLARLGDVLRAALRKGTPAETTLASEVALAKAYVEVEQIRFAGRLSVLFEIVPALENALVPNFILQPLIENAITHGLRGGQTSGAIWVRAVSAANDLVLTVSDNGSGPPAERLADLELGIGLGSTCERLERMYPGRHTISMKKLTEGGMEICIILPLRLADPESPSLVHEPASSAHR